MEKLVGKWQVTSRDNMINVFKAFGMSEEKQKAFGQAGLQMSWCRDNNDPSYWLHHMNKPDGHIKTTRFRLGEDFDTRSPDGRPTSCHIKEVDGKIVECHTDVQDPALSYTITREITGDDELIATSTVGDVVGVTRLRRMV